MIGTGGRGQRWWRLCACKPWATIIPCCCWLLIMPLLSAIGLIPITSLSILGGVLPQLEAAGMDILPIAVALVIGFSLAMMLAPMGPAVNLLARFGQVSQLKVAFGWNGLFVAASLPLLLAFLALLV